MKIENVLGEVVRKKRGELGLTQKEFAVRCELDQSIISRIEKGQIARPTEGTCISLAAGLQMTVEEIIKLRAVQREALVAPLLRVCFPHTLVSAPLILFLS